MDELQEIARRRVDGAMAAYMAARAEAKAANAPKHGCADRKYSRFMTRHARLALAAAAGAKAKGAAKASARRKGAEPYQAAVAADGKSADLYVYGDITADPRPGTADVSLDGFNGQLAELPDTVERLTVHVNSYGGDVFQGIGIYNSLKAWDGEVSTTCDGLAASIASVVFMAGKSRTMAPASLLFLHNAWKVTVGNATDHRKAADDLDVITGLSVSAYLTGYTGTEAELRAVMDAETWVAADDAVAWGLATGTADAEAGAEARARLGAARARTDAASGKAGAKARAGRRATRR